jgi:hypothetical protein
VLEEDDVQTLKCLGVVLIVGCAPQAPMPVVEAGAGSSEELGSSLNVRVVQDSARLEIHVTNVASSPIVLEFMTTQRYDFEVSSPDGDPVWRWSADKAFGEALGTESLAPGESRRYEATWSGGGRSGDFVATARIVSANFPVELRTVFRLPAE